MEYSISQLSKIAGISTRTLRYYEEIGLLLPVRTSNSHYRVYGEKEINLLQQILFYRELEIPLTIIKSIVTRDDFDPVKALHQHKEVLLEKKKQLEQLINNVNMTLSSYEGGITMSDQAKFEGFKKEMIRKNEEQYGEEIHTKYGAEKVEAYNKKFASLSKEEWDKAAQLENELMANLKEAMLNGSTTCEAAKNAVSLHRQWLNFFGNYTNEAHIGLGKMYVEDERFTAYYEEKAGKGAAQFLSNAIEAYYKE